MHLVSVDRLAADKLALPLLVSIDAFDFLGNILGVHIVHDRPERGDIVGRGFHAGVDAIQQRDISDPVFREVPLHIMAGQDIIPPQTGEVLCDDHIDPPGLDVGNHSLKSGSLEAGSAPSIVDVSVIYAKPVFLDKLVQQRFLIGHALRRTFVIVLL